jgi:hypothetical protein
MCTCMLSCMYVSMYVCLCVCVYIYIWDSRVPPLTPSFPDLQANTQAHIIHIHIQFKDSGSPPVLQFRLSISLKPLKIVVQIWGEYLFCIGTCKSSSGVGVWCPEWCPQKFFTIWTFTMERWTAVLWDFKTKSIDSTPPDSGLVKITQEDVKSLQVSWTGFDVRLCMYSPRIPVLCPASDACVNIRDVFQSRTVRHIASTCRSVCLSV